MKKIWDFSIFIIVIFAVLIVVGVMKPQDIKKVKMAEETILNLKEIRIALEKYYVETGKYPNLLLEGANENLELLDYTNEKGKVISFAKIYGKKELASTPEIIGIEKNNEVHNVRDFQNVTQLGGWNYNYTDQTGEIHINLPENCFNQNIDWNTY